MFFEGLDSIDGYQMKLLESVDEKIQFNKCICTVKNHDELKQYECDKYIPVDYEMCERNRYDQNMDMNALIPLDKEILEKMLPYESTAMKMLVRNMEQELYTYDESKYLYLQHLRFWNHMFKTYSINYVFQVCVPHHAHDYIIYGLAKVYGCKHIINEATSIWNHWIPVHDLYEDNSKMIERAKEIAESSEDVVLSDYVEHYYQSLLFQNRNMDKNLLNAGKSRKQHIADQKKVYEGYFYLKKRWNRSKGKLKHLVIDGMLKSDGERIKSEHLALQKERDFYKRSKIKYHQMRSINYYDSLAVQPDYDEKFIIYFLHYQPEATTLPQAGVFAEQELVIEILAASLKKFNITLYVKEHFVQPYRQKSFYDSLKCIPNVKMIKSTIDSKELLIHSIATATCNGTIIQESIFNGKPVLTFGHGPFNGAPGTYQCGNEIEISNAIQQIMQDNKIDQHQVRAYLKAFDEMAVYTNVYPSMKSRGCDIPLEKSRENLMEEIVQMIKT